MHVKVERTQKPIIYQVIFNSQAKIENYETYSMTQPEKNNLFNSTFYSLAISHGTEVAISDKNFQESIKIGNLFYELGYGFIVITTMKTANHNLVMRVFPKRLREAGYTLKCGQNKIK